MICCDTTRPHALFIPGRVIVLWECSSAPSGSENDASVDCRGGDGGLNVLRNLEVEATMFSDHACTKYLRNLAALLDQRENTI